MNDRQRRGFTLSRGWQARQQMIAIFIFLMIQLCFQRSGCSVPMVTLTYPTLLVRKSWRMYNYNHETRLPFLDAV